MHYLIVDSSSTHTSFLFDKEGYCYHADPAYYKYRGRHISEVKFAMQLDKSAKITHHSF